jgi:polyhydroxybutyrate depolymerase
MCIMHQSGFFRRPIIACYLVVLSITCISGCSENKSTPENDLGTGGSDDSGVSGDTGNTSGTGGSTGDRSAGCGKTATILDAKTNQTITVDGSPRYYLAYIPPTYQKNTALPLVFALHGLGMNDYWAANAEDGFKLIEATKNQAILVYPQGSGDEPKNETQLSGITALWLKGDYPFIDQLLQYMEDNYCVDTARVFVAGFSMGAMLSNQLGCDRAKVFRAIAPVEGWGPGEERPTLPLYCDDATAAIPAMITQGTADAIVTLDVGQASRDFWRDRNGCSSTTKPFINNCVEYQNCTSGFPVAYCEHSGNHLVPGNSGENIWAFFSKF